MTDGTNDAKAKQDAEHDVDSVDSDDTSSEVESKALGLDDLPDAPTQDDDTEISPAQ